VGTGSTEAIVEKLRDKVLVKRAVPERVNEGRAEMWLVRVEGKVCIKRAEYTLLFSSSTGSERRLQMHLESD
jgi:hypothetical protein